MIREPFAQFWPDHKTTAILSHWSNINGAGAHPVFLWQPVPTTTDCHKYAIETAGWGCHDRAHQSSPS
jgi:hypothetical protein